MPVKIPLLAASKIIRTLAKTSLLRDYLTHQQQRLLKGFVYVKYSFERALQFLYQKLIDQRDDCEDVSGCTYDRADSVRIILLTTSPGNPAFSPVVDFYHGAHSEPRSDRPQVQWYTRATRQKRG